MFNELAKSQDLIKAALATAKRMDEGAAAKGRYIFQCLDKDGKLKWEDVAPNLVVNVGLQDMNAKYFLGSAYTATWFIGLITGPGSGTTIVAADNAGTHTGWAENTGYSNATRPTASFGTATLADPSVISNSVASGGTLASFSINASSTIAGAFLISNSTKGGTTGILFSASDFTSPNDRVVVSGDTLNVTYTFSLDAV
jgi:hypothetical protein